MSENLETCVDPYLDSFAESFAAANYKASTIDHYRYLAGKLGRAMDAVGISPSSLTPDVAAQLVRDQRKKKGAESALPAWLDGSLST